MSILKRYNQLGNAYFVTTNAFKRAPLLRGSEQILRNTLIAASVRADFEITAWVILPEHLHLLVTSETTDLSRFMHSFKRGSGMKIRKKLGLRSGRVWQLRFWDHIIRDQDDLNHHIHYIHYNPVRHGLVKRPIEYEWSSFRQFVAEGFYAKDWGSGLSQMFDKEYGE